MDLILSDSPPLAGVRGPERRYALIDFEIARLVDINQPSTIPAIFKRDINMLARAAEIYLRVGVQSIQTPSLTMLLVHSRCTSRACATV